MLLVFSPCNLYDEGDRKIGVGIVQCVGPITFYGTEIPGAHCAVSVTTGTNAGLRWVVVVFTCCLISVSTVAPAGELKMLDLVTGEVVRSWAAAKQVWLLSAISVL